MTTVPSSQAAAAEVGHALDLLAQLPTYVDDLALPLAVRVACLECYFVNLRLIVEFAIKEPKPADFSRREFLPDWRPAPGHRVDFLLEQWTLANRQVVHLSRERIPPTGGIITLHPIKLFMITLSVFKIMDEFVVELMSRHHPATETFERLVRSAKSGIKWPARAAYPNDAE
jgi:hypothetical protein